MRYEQQRLRVGTVSLYNRAPMVICCPIFRQIALIARDAMVRCIQLVPKPRRRHPMPTRTQKTETLPARYRGLTAKQARALLEIDELARGAHDAKLVKEVACRYVTDLGTALTVEGKRGYAMEAEAAGMNGVAYAWYQMIADAPDATAAERGLFRAFLVRVGWIEEAKKRGYELTPEELRPVAERRLREARGGDFDNLLPSALDIFVQLRDRDGIACVLRRAVQLGRHDVAARAAKDLGRPLSQRELLRIARHTLKHDTMYFRDAAAYIAEHGLHVLYRPLIEQMAGCVWVSFAQLTQWARRLDIPLTIRLLERFYRAQDRDRSHSTEDLVASAHALARKSPAWRRRLPQIYARCRAWAVAWKQPELAERYGRKCGQPLTIAELREMAEYFSHSGHAHLDWARAGRAFCLRLAAERIAGTTGPTPTSPPEHEDAAAA